MQRISILLLVVGALKSESCCIAYSEAWRITDKCLNLVIDQNAERLAMSVSETVNSREEFRKDWHN